jgi:hypothetical protein
VVVFAFALGKEVDFDPGQLDGQKLTRRAFPAF